MTEPALATPTLARIYARQGLTERARQIYLRLLQRAPDDVSIRAALAELEAQERETAAADQQAQGNPPQSFVDLELSEDSTCCRWHVSAVGLSGAELALATPGRLVLRAAFFLGEETELEDIELKSSSGQTSFRLGTRALLVSAAVGLMAGDKRFVAIAHATPKKTRNIG